MTELIPNSFFAAATTEEEVTRVRLNNRLPNVTDSDQECLSWKFEADFR